MAGWIPRRLHKGRNLLSSETTTTCTTAGTYYKISGTWTNGVSGHSFEADGSGKLTYVGDTGVSYLLIGNSDLSSDKVATVTYGLYKNGVLVTNFETPTDFASANKIRSIGINNFITLNTHDYLEVYVKSSVDATTITHKTLNLTLLGDV
ncbi:MAG: hypothetical protein EOL95_09765 [Bacteroidia bacterium]|nr:hypothetical protein [Bacteroidia bacterium]